MDAAWISLLLTRELISFSREIELFDDENKIWQTLPGISNSTGNLVLHVCGNLQHFVGATLGGTGYLRNREYEFSTRGLSREHLLNELETTRATVDAVLASLPPSALSEDFLNAPSGLRMPAGLFLLHLSAHLAHHLGQVGYLRRILTGSNQSSGALGVSGLVPTS